MSIEDMIKNHNTEIVNTNELILNDNNPNKMNALQFQGLEYSLEKYGYVDPVVVNQHNKVINGNHRVRVYLNKKIPVIPVIRINFQNEEEEIIFARTMNLLHGKYDPDLQASEVRKLVERKENIFEVMRLTGLESKKDLLKLIEPKKMIEKPIHHNKEVKCPDCGNVFSI